MSFEFMSVLVDLQISSRISFFFFFLVKIDKDKQLVILEEEHEASWLLEHVKSYLSQVGDWIDHHLCVFRTFLPTIWRMSFLRDSPDILWWLFHQFYPPSETLNPPPTCFSSTYPTLSVFFLHSFPPECSLLNNRHIHRLQLQVPARWRTRLLPTLLHLLQSSG